MRKPNASKLIKSPLENIKEMAPRLTKEQQIAVFGMVYGLFKGNEAKENTGPKEVK